MMETLAALVALCPQGSIPIVITILGLAFIYFKIKNERKETKVERDQTSEELRTKLAILENEISRIKALDLESKLAQILTDLAWLKDKLK